MNKTVGNVPRTPLHEKNLDDKETLNQIIEDILVTTMHMLRTSISAFLNFQSLGTIAFNRDMLSNIPFQVDLQVIHQK